MTGIVLPKEDSLPAMEEKQEEVKEYIEEHPVESGPSLQDILMGFEQRILNLEATLLRIRGAI
jgi:hypothetical protein